MKYYLSLILPLCCSALGSQTFERKDKMNNRFPYQKFFQSETHDFAEGQILSVKPNADHKLFGLHGRDPRRAIDYGKNADKLNGLVLKLHMGHEKNYLKHKFLRLFGGQGGRSPWMEIALLDQETGEYVATIDSYTKKGAENHGLAWGQDDFRIVGFPDSNLWQKVAALDCHQMIAEAITKGWWRKYLQKDSWIPISKFEDVAKLKLSGHFVNNVDDVRVGAYLASKIEMYKPLFWKIFYPRHFDLFNKYRKQKLTNYEKAFNYPFKNPHHCTEIENIFNLEVDNVVLTETHKEKVIVFEPCGCGGQGGCSECGDSPQVKQNVETEEWVTTRTRRFNWKV